MNIASIHELADEIGCRLEPDDDEGELASLWRDDVPVLVERTASQIEAYLLREIRLRHGPFN